MLLKVAAITADVLQCVVGVVGINALTVLLILKRTNFDMVATVERIEYDPNRTAFIALITFEDGVQSYIVAPQRLAAGDKVVSSMNSVDVKPAMQCHWKKCQLVPSFIILK